MGTVFLEHLGAYVDFLGGGILKPELCIYHGNCADGFGAALAVWLKYGNDVKYHAGVYGQPMPDVNGQDVVLVDFSYKRAQMSELCAKNKSVLVLDHHKSAMEDLDGLEKDYSNLTMIFDMEKSGAMLAWNYYMETPPPPLFLHIEDRDLWKFKLDGTREIQAAVFSYPYDFKVWADLLSAPTHLLRSEGAAIERKHHKDIAELLTVARREMVIGGVRVPVVNLPYTMASDACHEMAKTSPFAASYYDSSNKRCFSLRSIDGGADVSKIAEIYGGGGHKHAAGFAVEIGWEGE